MARRPAGAVTLIVEPDRDRFRSLLDRLDLSEVFARRGLKLAVGEDALGVASAVLSLPAWAEPARVELGGGACSAARARARRVIDGTVALARRRSEVSPGERRRWIDAIQRDPRRLLRLPIVMTP